MFDRVLNDNYIKLLNSEAQNCIKVMINNLLGVKIPSK
jgi:hypothetical protein